MALGCALFKYYSSITQVLFRQKWNVLLSITEGSLPCLDKRMFKASRMGQHIDDSEVATS